MVTMVMLIFWPNIFPEIYDHIAYGVVFLDQEQY